MIKRIASAATLILIMALPLWGAQDDSNKDPGNANELLKNGKYAEAEAAFLELISENGESNDLLIGLGRAYLYQKKIDKSYDIFNNAVGKYGSPESWFFRGFCNQQKGSNDESESDYLKAIEKGYDYYDVYFNLGFLSLQKKDYKQGEKWFRKSIEKNQNFDQSWYYLGYCEFYENQDAYYDFSKAIELNPKMVMAYIYRGNIFEGMGDYEKAVSDFKKGVELAPEYAWARFYLGNALYKSGNNSDAIGQLNKALEMNLKDGRVYDSLAGAYWSSGDLTQAEENYNRAVEAAADSPWAWNDRGYFYRQLKKYEKAIEDFRKAIQLAPEWALPYNNLGYSYNQLEDYQSALEPLETAIKLKPDWSWPWNNYGNTLSGLGRIDEAVTSYLKSNECDPGYAMPFSNLGILYFDQGDYNKAVEYEKKSIQINPKSSNSYNSLGNSLKMLGRKNEAIDAYNRGIEINPENMLLLQNRGLIFYETGEYAKAVEDLTKAVEKQPDSAFCRKYLGLSLIKTSRPGGARIQLQKAIDLNPSYQSELGSLLDRLADLENTIRITLSWNGIPQSDVSVTFIGLSNPSSVKFTSDENGVFLMKTGRLVEGKTYLLYDGDYRNPSKIWDFSNVTLTYSESKSDYNLPIRKKLSITSPEKEQVISDTIPLLEWQKQEEAETYLLTISKKTGTIGKGDKAFNSYTQVLKLSDLTAAEYQFKSPLEPETYLWSVTGFSKSGVPIYFGSSTFTIADNH